MFAATETYPVPNKDILSYLFDEPKYDQNRPVSYTNFRMHCFRLTNTRFTLMHITQTAAYHVAKLAALCDI